MELFFHVKPGAKRVEYEWTGTAWRPIGFGSYLTDVVNAVLDEDLPRLEEATGRRGEEAVLQVWHPLMLVAIRLAGASAHPEDLGYLLPGAAWPSETNDLVYYVNGQDQTLWYEWLQTRPRPLFATGYRLGWTCTCATTAQAAAAEAVLGLMHGWKLRACKVCGRFYTGRNCDRCAADGGERRPFLHLLAVHRGRYKGRYPEAAGEIDSLRERIQNGDISLDAARRDYKDRICILYGIPTAWAIGKKRKKKPR